MRSHGVTRPYLLGGMLAFVLLTSGCVGTVVSLQALFERTDLAFDPMLLGTWDARDLDLEEHDETTTWTVQPLLDGGYRLLTVSGANRLAFRAYLVRLGGSLFLDVIPDDAALAKWWPYVLPVHVVFRIWMNGDGAMLAIIDEAWLRKRVAGGDVSVAHVRVGDDIVLTGATGEIRKFLIQHAGDEGAFMRVAILVRAE
jgi:hypothetical protein